MPPFKREYILGFETASNDSAHSVHFKTVKYTNGLGDHVVTKQNKEGIEQASLLEAGFTAVANLFTKPAHMLRMDLITEGDSRAVYGVCSDHAANLLRRTIADTPDTVFLQVPKFPFIENKNKNKNKKIAEIKKKGLLAFYQHLTLRNPIEPSPPEEKHALSSVYDGFDEVWINEIATKYAVSQEVIRAYFTQLNDLEVLAQARSSDDPPYAKEMAKRVDLLNLCKTHHETNVRIERQVAAFDAGKGYDFLHNTPPNFFSKLLLARKLGHVSIDMDSLADVLATAYGLEEDDLHKANIGFYISLEDDKPCYHFFKIDHDLMFNARIMATKAQRPSNITHRVSTFKINSKSLLHFPEITGGPHYWPTRYSLFVAGRKAYTNREDRKAFRALQHDPEFKQAKWRRFLKQAVMSELLIAKSLDQTYGDLPNVEGYKVEIQRQTVEKISELRMALLALPEFRKYYIKNFMNLSKVIEEEIKKQAIILGIGLPPDEKELEPYIFEVKSKLFSLATTCTHMKKDKSFTPLHAAVLTQSYRTPQSAVTFKRLLNKKDADEMTALDYAVQQYEEFDRLHKNPRDVNYYEHIISDLKAHGAKCSKFNDSEIIKRLTAEEKVTNFQAFEAKLAEISRSSNSLKSNKLKAVELLKNAELPNEVLAHIKGKLSQKRPEAPYDFIKQRDSTTYFMKKIKKEYGKTGTSAVMLDLISSKIKKQTKEQFKQAKLSKLGFMAKQGEREGDREDQLLLAHEGEHGLKTPN